MALDSKISALPDATLPIASGVKFEAVQGGINVKVDADDMPGSGATVPDADASTKGIAKLYTDVAAQNTDGAPDQNAVFDALALKAPLASPTFTGTPAVPTAAQGTNTTQAASTAFVFAEAALKADKHPAANRQTASYTLVLTDDGKIVEMNVASANNLTIPPNSSVAFPVNTFVTLVQYGAGLTTVVPGGGVTIRTSSGILTSPGQYSPMVIQKIATDEWYLWNGVPTPVSFGTYTPTLTNVSNVTASTAYLCTYLRVGNTVTVSGRFDIDPTTTTTSTLLGISLPVSSIFTTANQCGGTAAATAIAGQVAAIRSDAAQARAEVIYNCVDVTNQPMYFTFTYQVL